MKPKFFLVVGASNPAQIQDIRKQCVFSLQKGLVQLVVISTSKPFEKNDIPLGILVAVKENESREDGTHDCVHFRSRNMLMMTEGPVFLSVGYIYSATVPTLQPLFERCRRGEIEAIDLHDASSTTIACAARELTEIAEAQLAAVK